MIVKDYNGIGYILAKKEVDPGKLSLVFIHGAGGSHQMWLGQISYFSRSYNAIAINLPGHGLGKRKGLDRIEGYAEVVLELIKGLSLDDVILVGLSMGGAIVQQCALDYGGMFRAIVLSSTGAKLKVMPEIFQLIDNKFDAYLEVFPKFAFGPDVSAVIIEQTIEELKKIDRKVIYNDFIACDRFNLIERVKDINLPCLIIVGSLDKLTPPKYSLYLNEQIKGSKLVQIEGAGHIVNLEKPKEFNQAIEEFIKELRCGKGENG